MFRNKARYLVAILIAAALHVQAPLFAQSQMASSEGRQPLVVRFAEGGVNYELRLNAPVLANRISGTFRTGDVGVRFRGTRTGERTTFSLNSLAGKSLYMFQQDKEVIRTSFLGGRLQQELDMALAEVIRKELKQSVAQDAPEAFGFITQGDEGVLQEFLALSEVGLLPRLSMLLGAELGYTGVDYPATKPLVAAHSNP